MPPVFGGVPPVLAGVPPVLAGVPPVFIMALPPVPFGGVTPPLPPSPPWSPPVSSSLTLPSPSPPQFNEIAAMAAARSVAVGHRDALNFLDGDIRFLHSARAEVVSG